MYNSIILPLAKEDIQEAALWYNKQQKGLGKRFTTEVREKVHFIRQNPKTSHVRYNGCFLKSSIWYNRLKFTQLMIEFITGMQV